MVVKRAQSIKIKSDVALLQKVANVAENIGRSAGMEEHDVNDLAIAVSEAVNNAIVHGNRGDRNKEVSISFNIKDDVVEVLVEDEGAGFDPDEIEDPRDPRNVLKDSGRGLLIVESLMDSISIESSSSGTLIIMSKSLTTKDSQ